MWNYLISKYRSSNKIIHYFILTYLDKIISFAMPLFFLFIIKDKELYSYVEVAFSYATLAMIVVELGISNYLFYGYKHAEDKELFISRAQVFFKFLLSVYLCLSALLLIGVKIYDNGLLTLFSFVIIRTLFMLYLNFYSNVYRLKDKPSQIYLTSVLINIISFVSVLAAVFFSLSNKIVYFFLPSLALILFFCLRFVFTEIASFRFRDFYLFIKKALQYSWPIIINVLAMSFMNNYAKIYAFGHLSQQEMVQISYIMRIGLIVQLTHSSFSSYFSKALFMDVTHKLNVRIFKQYNLVLLFSTFLVSGIILVTNYLFSDLVQIPFSLSTALFIVYIILWCYIGYLELYFGVMNANRKVLMYSIVSSLVYISLLQFGGHIDILKLSIFMSLTAFLNLTLVLIGLSKLKVLTFNVFKSKK